MSRAHLGDGGSETVLTVVFLAEGLHTLALCKGVISVIMDVAPLLLQLHH